MIDITRHDGLHVLRLARAPVNALDLALCEALVQALRNAVDKGGAGIVLAGGDKVFSAGLDVPWLLSLGTDRTALHAAWSAFFDAARALANCPVPVAAAITGHSPAGGCVLALCCDHRVMADGAFQIGLNETQVGLAVPEGIQRLLRSAVGEHRAAQLLTQGAMVDATTARDIGLVDALAPHGAVIDAALDWLRPLARLPRRPMLETRRIARRALVEALEPALVDLEGMLDLWTHPDTQQGLRALLAKLGK